MEEMLTMQDASDQPDAAEGKTPAAPKSRKKSRRRGKGSPATDDADPPADAEVVPADDADETPAPASGTSPGRRGDPPADEPLVDGLTAASVVEAILMATDAPLPAAKIAQILGVGDARDVKRHVAALNERYAAEGRSFRIEEIARGFQILTQPAYNPWVTQVLRVRQDTKLTGAALETLAIIAYRQPVLRAQVEAIRGVAAGDLINRLREMNLVTIVGRAEEIGRPMLYGTTKKFLDVFGLASLDDLPKVEELLPPPA